MRYFWRAYKTEMVLTARTGNDYDYGYVWSTDRQTISVVEENGLGEKE